MSELELFQIAPIFREALAAHSLLEVFGIPAEDIFIALTEMGAGVVRFQVVARQDERQFCIDIADFGDTSKKEMMETWTLITSVWNSSSWEDRDRLVESTTMRDRAVQLFGAMLVKGFVNKNAQTQEDRSESE